MLDLIYLATCTDVYWRRIDGNETNANWFLRRSVLMPIPRIYRGHPKSDKGRSIARRYGKAVHTGDCPELLELQIPY